MGLTSSENTAMRILSLFLVAFLLPQASSALEVFACEPEWGSLVTELAGDNASVTVATTAFQDPHRLQAKPSLIAAIRNADLVVCTGADLEIGWLPLLLRRGGSAEVFSAADHVRKLEVPRVVDRTQGDIHPQGNPHVHLDPRNIRRIADALAEQLKQADAANAAAYESRLMDFQQRWAAAIDAWEQRASGLAGLRIASHHRSFSYLANWLDLDIVATLESKPGIPPSGAQLASLLERLSDDPPLGVIRTPYENEKPSLWLSDRLSIPAIELPYTIGGNATVVDLFTLFDNTLKILEEYRQ
jgi:zinc/manganese transport system substrate-binding protein